MISGDAFQHHEARRLCYKGVWIERIDFLSYPQADSGKTLENLLHYTLLSVATESDASGYGANKKGNSTVTRVTFWSFHDTELFTILFFSNPSCGCC